MSMVAPARWSSFLEGYHIRILHRDSIYRFFLDAESLVEAVGPHLRAISGRRALLDAPDALQPDADLRTLSTPTFAVLNPPLSTNREAGCADLLEREGVAQAHPLRIGHNE